MSEKVIQSFCLTEDEFTESFLPTLLGRVFHFTTSAGWEQIRACGYIDTNQGGKFKATSVHTNESLGRRLGAVCLFDLRNKGREILAKELILYDYFNRRLRREPSYFLVFDDRHLSAITTLVEVEESLRKQTMYIPGVESWHVGNLPLDKIEVVYQVQKVTG